MENKERLQSVAIWGLLVVTSVTTGFLITQNLGLQARLAEFPQLPSTQSLEPGEQVEGFETSGIPGAISIRYSGTEKTRVFLFLSPDCFYCGEQLPYWREMIAGLDSDRFEVIAVGRDVENPTRLGDYVKQSGLGPLEIAVVSSELRTAYKFTATPLTLVVNNEGMVEKAWLGRWNRAEAEEARAFFGY